MVFQVKSGNVGRGEVSKLNNDRAREGAELAVFLTLQPSTLGMRREANASGTYEHELMGRSYPRVQIVTIQEMLEQHKRLDIPLTLNVLPRAQALERPKQTVFDTNTQREVFAPVVPALPLPQQMRLRMKKRELQHVLNRSKQEPPPHVRAKRLSPPSPTRLEQLHERVERGEIPGVVAQYEPGPLTQSKAKRPRRANQTIEG